MDLVRKDSLNIQFDTIRLLYTLGIHLNLQAKRYGYKRGIFAK